LGRSTKSCGEKGGAREKESQGRQQTAQIRKGPSGLKRSRLREEIQGTVCLPGSSKVAKGQEPALGVSSKQNGGS